MVMKVSVAVDGVVLDLMAGTGKTGAVAKKLERKFIMIDIDDKLCNAMRARLKVPI
jgi:DNA modification methylase